SGSTSGTLTLAQSATGGTGGSSSTTPGIGGDAASNLTYTDALAALTNVTVNATGGTGGAGVGVNGASGGYAQTTTTVTGSLNADLTANLIGGAGGAGSGATFKGADGITLDSNTVPLTVTASSGGSGNVAVTLNQTG